MEKQTYGILDIAKFVSSLLVVAIHCAPLIEISEPANFVLVQILARLAVPFFFIASGWLFFQKIDPQKSWKDETNVKALKHYWKRILRIYLVWSALYMPLIVVSWVQGGFHWTSLIRLIRDFLFNGTYYHLWFLPALLLGVPIVYMMYLNIRKQSMLWLSFLLYMAGMAINVYGSVLSQEPFLESVLNVYQSFFVTSRNGLFFAPIYLVLGIYIQDFLTQDFKKQSFVAFTISFVFYAAEAIILQACGIMNDLTCMYAMLLPTTFFLFLLLMQFRLKKHKMYVVLRNMSLYIYTGHIYFVYVFLNVFHLGNLSVYLLSIICASIFAYLMIQGKHLIWLKEVKALCGLNK